MEIPGNMLPAALTVAGSDPSGGAGIQVDLKTFSTLGVFGMAVITAITAQNSCRVTGSWIMNPEIVKEQISTLFEDITPQAIKTGMLANEVIIEAVVETLPLGIPLVVDPVMVSTSGYRLLDHKAITLMRDLLIPRSFLVTPNIPEAEILADIGKIQSDSEMVKAGEVIIELGAENVLIKGGHRIGINAKDLLIASNELRWLESPMFPYAAHGSGCCLSAAITGYLANGKAIIKACELGKKFVSHAIEHAIIGRCGMRMVCPEG